MMQIAAIDLHRDLAEQIKEIKASLNDEAEHATARVQLMGASAVSRFLALEQVSKAEVTHHFVLSLETDYAIENMDGIRVGLGYHEISAPLKKPPTIERGRYAVEVIVRRLVG